MRDGRKLTVRNWCGVRWNLSGYLWPAVLININSIINLRPCYSRSLPNERRYVVPRMIYKANGIAINTSTIQLTEVSRDFNCFLIVVKVSLFSTLLAFVSVGFIKDYTAGKS